MTNPPDLSPAAQRLRDVVRHVDDAQLDHPTPCEGRTVSQLLAHISGLTMAFRAAADKELGPLTDTNPDENGWPEASSHWRDEILERTSRLADAWQQPEAWTGMTRAGGVDLPAEVMGLVALGEITFHAWDLAAATGQSLDVDDATVEALKGYAEGFDPAGTPGMFLAAVDPSHTPTDFERVIARTGRDPRWQARKKG
ncbi:TIGR03086 family metal-binding protein [Knoellia sp. CPCC 206453]|uniref:TIGR03086 family metal-binding protein n=1 Tax=Knoellia pratensis TaxID=3404796 RepID=UPI00360B1625